MANGGENLKLIEDGQVKVILYNGAVIKTECSWAKSEFDEYQDFCKGTAKYPNVGNNLTYPVLGLCGESGEVAEKVKKLFRDSGGVLTPEVRKAILKEIGDVAWYVAMVAHEIGYNMSDVITENKDKLTSRKERNVISGSGDER